MSYNEETLEGRPMEQIDSVMDNVLRFMKEHAPDSDEFGKAAHNLKELCEARERLAKSNQNLKETETLIVKSRFSPQFISILAIAIPALTGLIQVGAILYHEELNVITTKAVAFVVKGRF